MLAVRHQVEEAGYTQLAAEMDGPHSTRQLPAPAPGLGGWVSWPLLRGQVVRADIGLNEPKLFVVVSNNRRNNVLPQVLTVRLTTTPKPSLPSSVELGHPKAFVGYAVCDDLAEIYQKEVIAVTGALSAPAMRAVNARLAAALALP